MIPDTILIHYGEIALKGKNRNFFVEWLIQNIKSQIESFAPGSFEYVKKFSGSILIKPNKNGIKNIEKVKGALLHTFGITNFHFAVNVKQDIEALKKTCCELFNDENFETFCINTRRSNNNFHLNLAQINEKG